MFIINILYYNMKYKIILYTLCWNEIDILPFVIDYWKVMGISKAVVYDNESDDGSKEYLQQFDWIEVRNRPTNGEKDNDAHKKLKDECWKESVGQYDFIMVCDIDEVLYFPQGIEKVLDKFSESSYNVLGAHNYALVEDYKPQRKEGLLAHEMGLRWYPQSSNHMSQYKGLGIGKFVFFKSDANISWSVGQHLTYGCKPMVVDEGECISLHFFAGFGADYKVERNKKQRDRLSQNNKNKGYSSHYKKSEDEMRREYRECQEKSVDINEVIRQKKSHP